MILDSISWVAEFIFFLWCFLLIFLHETLSKYSTGWRGIFCTKVDCHSVYTHFSYLDVAMVFLEGIPRSRWTQAEITGTHDVYNLTPLFIHEAQWNLVPLTTLLCTYVLTPCRNHLSVITNKCHTYGCCICSPGSEHC